MRKCYNDHNQYRGLIHGVFASPKARTIMSKSATTNNTTKRYDGEGTINQRKDGRWEYRVSLGKVNGKYAYKSFYAPTERELKKLIKQYNSDRQKYLCEADKTPFWQHAEHWMRVYKFQTSHVTQLTA